MDEILYRKNFEFWKKLTAVFEYPVSLKNMLQETISFEYRLLSGHNIAGGLKRPALERWLPLLQRTHFSYVGSVYGLGGLALAHACHSLGYGCELHLAEGRYKHDWLAELPGLNCKVTWHAPQPVEMLRSTVKDALPSGFADDGFISALGDVLREEGSKIGLHDGGTGEQIWLPIVSGTLAQAALRAFPQADLRGVKVARHTPDLSGLTLYQAPEKYHHPTKILPPYPACAFSDAKVWRAMKEEGRNGSVVICVS